VLKAEEASPQGGALKSIFSQLKIQTENLIDWTRAFLPPADTSFPPILVNRRPWSRPRAEQAKDGLSNGVNVEGKKQKDERR